MTKLIENTKNYKTLAAWLDGGRFPHAILLDGAKGSGRRTFAGEIGKALLCTGHHRPCDKCNHCMKVGKDIHPDLITVRGEGGARSFHISQVREIRAEAWMAPNDGEIKVFMLLNAEEMSTQAQNALLKLIEEPPAGVYFILTCENKNQMLTTIRSRVWAMTMDNIQPENIVGILKEKFADKTNKQLETIAAMSQGNVGTALRYAESVDEFPEYQTAEKIWQVLEGRRELEALALLAKFERDKQGLILQLKIMREIISAQLKKGKNTTTRSATPLQLVRIIDIIDEACRGLDGNVNTLLVVTVLPAQISKVLTDR